MEVSEAVARELLSCVDALAARPEECARSPGRDFARNRKLGLGRLLLLLCTWGRDCAYAELAELCGWDGEAPSGPALTQQWAKLNDRAMPELLRLFLSRYTPRAAMGRYRLYAADGTEWQLEACQDSGQRFIRFLRQPMTAPARMTWPPRSARRTLPWPRRARGRRWPRADGSGCSTTR